jgi:hypothetical protein
LPNVKQRRSRGPFGSEQTSPQALTIFPLARPGCSRCDAVAAEFEDDDANTIADRAEDDVTMTEATTILHRLTPVVALPSLPVGASLHVGVVSQMPAPTDLRRILLVVNNTGPAKQKNPIESRSLRCGLEDSGSLDDDVSLASTANSAWK